jgi:quinol monooxygenase YgiN
VAELHGIARLRFHEGRVEELRHLSAQTMEVVRTKDSGTLRYDTYFNDDETECVVLERFRDTEALIERAENLGDLSAAILATVSVVHGELLGEPSEELGAKVAGASAERFHGSLLLVVSALMSHAQSCGAEVGDPRLDDHVQEEMSPPEPDRTAYRIYLH